MSTSDQTGYERLPPAAAGRVDEACDRFESAWREGSPPEIERFLDHVPTSEQTILIRELILLEAPFRRRAGDEPRTEDYRSRFPNLDATWLASALAATGLPGGAIIGAPTVPGYQLLGEIGRGGMGVVYKARQVDLDRIVAVKMILTGRHTGAAERARFQAEAEAVARLQHPNIVQVHECGTVDGHPYLVLEFVDGGNLAQATRGTAVAPRGAAAFVRTLAEAAQHAHERGIVHRDLKPANILLSGVRGQTSGVSKAGTPPDEPSLQNPKIADFGLVKRLEADATLTGGGVLGTPAYMAPEQTTGSGRDVGPLADVYALGVVLYELLTGRPPFLCKSALDTLNEVRNRPPVSVRTLRPGVPRDLDTICLKCLQKEPARRYRSAIALADDLRRYLNGEPIQARSVGIIERVALWARRHPAPAALIALVVLAVVVGLPGITWLWFRTERALDRETIALSNERQARLEADAELNAKRLVLARNAWLGGDLPAARAYLEETGESYRTDGWQTLWTACSAQRIVFREHGAVIIRIAISPDGRLVASADSAGTIHVWEADTGRIVRTLRTASRDGVALAFDASGSLVYTSNVPASRVGERAEIQVQVVDPVTGVEGRSLRRPATPRVELSPDGRRLLLVGTPTTVTSVETGLDDAPLANGPNFIFAVWSRNGRHIALVMANRTSVATADVAATGARLGRITIPDDQSVRGPAVAVSPDGDRLAYVRHGPNDLRPQLIVRDLPDGRLRTVFPLPQADLVLALEFSPDGMRLATASQDRTAVVLEASSGREIMTLRGHAQGLTRLMFSPNGRQLVTCGNDQTVRVWALP